MPNAGELCIGGNGGTQGVSLSIPCVMLEIMVCEGVQLDQNSPMVEGRAMDCSFGAEKFSSKVNILFYQRFLVGKPRGNHENKIGVFKDK